MLEDHLNHLYSCTVWPLSGTEFNWAVLIVMSIHEQPRWPFSPLNNEQMSNWLGAVEHHADQLG